MKITAPVILNPEAGSVTPELKDYLHSSFYNVYETSDCDDAVRIARSLADEDDVIVVAGGDGTLGEVLNAIEDVASEVKLGLLPLGTGNDFARALSIPTDPEEAVELIADGLSRPVDVIRFRGADHGTRLMLNVAVGGFRKSTMDDLEEDFKAFWGPLGQLAAAANAMRAVRLHDVTIAVDDQAPITEKVSALVVANAPHMSGGLNVVPSACCDDGELDVMLVTAQTTAELSFLLPLVASGTHLNSSHIRVVRGEKVTITSDPPMPYHLDGYAVTQATASFEILRDGVRVICPNPSADLSSSEKQGSRHWSMKSTVMM